jgi:hypothetical protein
VSTRADYEFLFEEEEDEEQKLVCYRDQLPTVILYYKDFGLIVKLLKREAEMGMNREQYALLAEVIEKQLDHFEFIDEDAPEEVRDDFEQEFELEL